MSDLLHHVEKLAVLVFLVSSMLGTGLTLTLRAITAPLRDVRLLLLTLGLNFVVSPGYAWLLTLVVPPDHQYAIGLLLLGGAAGAPFLPKVVETARGDVALAAAVMALLTLGTIVFLPLALPLMIGGPQTNAWSIARPLLLFIVLPLTVGMIGKSYANELAVRAAPILGMIANAALLTFLALLIVLNFRVLLHLLGSFVVVSALLYFCGLFVISWLLAGANREARPVLALATTARNFGAALGPAAASFPDPKVKVMIIVGAIICLAVSFGAAKWMARRV